MKKVSFFDGNPALEGTVLVISSDSPLKALNSDNFRPFFLQEKYAPLLDSGMLYTAFSICYCFVYCLLHLV